MLKAKRVSESVITMTELVLPNHTNQLGNLLGGQLMHWIDICAALCGAKHNQRVCVTASAESFKEGKRIHTNTAYLTFVAVDNDGKPTLAVEAIPESEDEKRRYEEALIRRENRLKDRIKRS